MIYLDHNATTPPSPKVREFIKNELADFWANASSEHALGAQLSDTIKQDRQIIADNLGVSTKGIVFTSGATESINSVLSDSNLEAHKITKIISSPLEHHATLDRLKYLAKRGFEVLMIPNDGNGQLDLEFLKTHATTNTLVTLLSANNEIGTINPIKEIAEISHQKGALIHVDAVQAWGKINFNLEDWDVDFASFSGHKIGALKGVGVLYAQNIKSYLPLLHGGGQERGYRPGTLNAAGIHSLALAVQDIDLDKMNEIEKLRDYMEEEILKIPGCLINAREGKRLPNTSSIYAGGRSSREILFELSRQGIYVSTGSACSSGSFEPSHVLKGITNDLSRMNGTIRVSLNSISSLEEVQKFTDLLSSAS